ncbi:multidrug resistance-associated protein 1 [Apis laboriosa]|uniref:multidrug resistance-associated protein 1 n=1 Tax=Apis laboriosa TaxID=183418 RepID=UPI001CC64362|nr:multidrug resistance-associated protein 1 [Apis laboriosa]XP_043784902.1 multidrug resistance-associated protein 1 [Apis laboriosa]XP_043784903.1 multidrug resistance-associated protein 1 [Apis laboriosa]
MDQFCGTEFWNYNLIWNTDDPEITECFQKTVLVWVPCAFLWLFSGIEIYYFLNSKNKNIPYTWLFISKQILIITLILLNIVDLGIAIHKSTYEKVYNVDYCTPIIRIVTFLKTSILVTYNRKYGMRTSGLLFLFWFLLALCGIIEYRSLLKLYINKNEISYSFISYMIYYPIVIFLFLLNFLVDAEPKYSKYPRAEKPCPEQKSSFPGKIFFSWFDSMAWKGFKKPLEITDLWSINPEDTAKEIVPKFEKYWKKNSQKRNNVQNTKASFRKGSSQVNFNNEYKKKTSSVLPPLCKAFGATFLFGAVLKFVQDIITFVSPQILQLLIDFIKGREPLWKGYFYAVLLLITAIFQTLVLSQYFHRMFLVGLRIRTALIAAIYRKALRMSNAARKESTVGEIVNLMSVDAQRFMDLTAYINMIWSAPLQIVLALYFLWDILGPAVLAGLAVLLILIPINVLITNRVKTLQIRQMKHKDERVKLMNEVLNGIKVLKLYAWEPSFEEQILKIRTKEIKVLKETAYLNSGTSFIWSFAPFLVSLVSFATYVLIDENNRLDSTKAFVSLSLFNILRFPLSILPMMIGNMVQAYVSVKRINKFMNTEELDPNNVQHDLSESYTLLIENGTFIWDMENIDRPTLKNINLQVEQGQLIAVVGTVGSGKSSLLSALLGEMEKINGRVNTKGSIAYVSQQAWIQNASLQDNVLFGKSLHKNLYNRVIEACALTPDLKVLPAGDQTEIGEKGINLSGGQKQRVSLARAVYNDSDIYFLDDPLSAVDSHVGKHIFENVIGSSGLLKKKTRILVTHGITYLPEVDNIIVLKDGEITEVGTYKQLLEKRGAFSEFLVQHLQEVGNLHADGESEADLHEIKQHLESTIGSNELQQKLTRGKSRMSESQSESGSIADRKSLNGSLKRQYSTSSQQSGTYENSNIKEAKLLSPKSGGKLIEVEKTETGSVKWRVYSHYFKSIGWFLSISTIIMNAIFQGFSIGSNTWLSMWSDDNLTDVNNTVDHIKQNMYLGVYGGLGLGQGMTVLGGALFLAKGTIRASVHLFESTLQRVLRNPMSFFDQTPTGRILNRLSKDTDVIDNTLPSILRSWITCLFGVIATLVVISFSTPIFISVIIPISVIYYFVQRLYVASSRQLKRLESVSRSPIYSHFSETVSGAQMIRAFGVQERFINESESKVDFNQVCYYPSIIANRWLAVRLEMVGNLIIFFAALFAVLNRDTISSGLVGLSVSYALQVTQTLNWLVRMTSDVETNIVAVERIKEYGETPQEASWKNPDYTPPKEWPVQGRVEFKDYKVRYREDLELVLRGLSFSIKGGEKVGIVGRTGAGKSSLTLALFRIIEAADGQIFIDDIDIAKLGLHDLRSRLTIIPQDPVLFSGSLRINLDPFNCYTDDEVWRALEHAHLKSFIKNLPNGLLYEVSEGGENLSIGQRQLICLARALLRKTKVLILDEATASVDLETDDLIQQTIRQEFKDCTILTIAHRLNTILDSDRIIVLDNGRIVEYDSPESLLHNSSSLFSSIAKDAGLAT